MKIKTTYKEIRTWYKVRYNTLATVGAKRIELEKKGYIVSRVDGFQTGETSSGYIHFYESKQLPL